MPLLPLESVDLQFSRVLGCDVHAAVRVHAQSLGIVRSVGIPHAHPMRSLNLCRKVCALFDDNEFDAFPSSRIVANVRDKNAIG